MVFQGFSFMAMALVSVGVIAYHFLKNRQIYLFDTPENQNLYSFSSEQSLDNIENRGCARRRKVIKNETCSICMELVPDSAFSLPLEEACSAIYLPCQHVFHTGCVATWLDENETCPNCRASVK